MLVDRVQLTLLVSGFRAHVGQGRCSLSCGSQAPLSPPGLPFARSSASGPWSGAADGNMEGETPTPQASLT